MIRILAFLVLLLTSGFVSAAEPAIYKIGISKSLFRDVPPELAKFAAQPFQDLMKEQTALEGEMIQKDSWLEMAQMLDTGRLHMGVFSGHEFAWVRSKFPNLEPLICSVYKPKETKGVILVRHDWKVPSGSKSKAVKVVLASTLRDHARLFWERKGPDHFKGASLSHLEATSNVHDAIHKVLEEEADVTVADFADWSYFKKLYPGRSENLKVLTASNEFPATVLVSKKGTLSDAALTKIRDGFLTAHQNRKAASIMKIIRIERFDAIPSNYEESLKTCLKEYPEPVSKGR